MDRIEELAQEIRHHSDLYFNGEAEITDAEFDELIEEMKRLDPDNAVLGEVGSEPTYGKKVEHPSLMGSLKKAHYDEDGKGISELMEWVEDRPVLASLKIDGIAVRLVYKDGFLQLAATRGNGHVGQDITDNVRYITAIPNHIEAMDHIEVRGEIYMGRKVYEEFKKEMKESGGRIPMNPRNATSGLVIQKDPRASGKVKLGFYAYDYKVISRAEMTGFNQPYTNEKTFVDIFRLAVPEIPYVPCEVLPASEEVIQKFILENEKSREAADVRADGIVFCFNEKDEQEKHNSYTGKCPDWKIAFKFHPEQQTSIVWDIEWQLGRSGKITPVAQIEPVEIDGSIVDSPTLHNYAQIRRLGLCIGDKVLIEKAGDIIPQIVQVVEEEIKEDRDHHSVINYPNLCPVCYEETELDEGQVSVWCRNPECPGQQKEKIIHFLKTIEAEGIGPGIVSKLIEHEYVKDISDLYSLDWGVLRDIPGLGEKSAKNIVYIMESKKEIPLATFLQSLGISGLGSTNSELIANYCKNLDTVLETGGHEFERLDGIGEKTSDSIVAGLSDHISLILKLRKVGVEVVPVVDSSKDKAGGLGGKSFCITGTLSIGRKEMAELIKEHGGIVKGSVSKGLDYLVAGDKTGKTKTDKAEKYGVEVIDEGQLREMMGE